MGGGEEGEGGVDVGGEGAGGGAGAEEAYAACVVESGS